MGKILPKNCGYAENDNKLYVDLQKLNKMPTIPNSFLAIKPPHIETGLIESYDHSNNLFFQINKILKLQRFIKKRFKKKRERIIFNKNVLEGSASDDEEDPEFKTGMFKSKSSNNNANKEEVKEKEKENAHCVRKRTQESFCISYTNSLRSFDRDNLAETSMKGFFMLKKKKNKYFGGIKDGKKEGYGVVKFEDGCKFKGQFRANIVRGFGKYTDSDGSYFVGEYDNSIPKGWGIFEHFLGSTFEGTWDGNKQNKIGYENWLDETYYQGEYKDSKKHGIGTYKWPDGTMYEGEWDNNIINGYGIIYFNDDRMYVGQLKKGQMHGYGEFSWPDNKKYFGFYNDDLKHGFGIFLFSSNPVKVYIGSWNDGKQHGVGLMINGKTPKYGLWNDGKLDFLFQGAWEMKKYAKGEHLEYYKFFHNEVDEILALFL